MPKPVKPATRVLIALCRFPLLIAREVVESNCTIRGCRARLVTVVSFIVENDNLPLATSPEILEDSEGHLLRGLNKRVLRFATEQELLCFRVEALALVGRLQHERVVVSDGNLGLVEGLPQVGRNDVALMVVVLRV